MKMVRLVVAKREREKKRDNWHGVYPSAHLLCIVAKIATRRNCNRFDPRFFVGASFDSFKTRAMWVYFGIERELLHLLIQLFFFF